MIVTTPSQSDHVISTPPHQVGFTEVIRPTRYNYEVPRFAARLDGAGGRAEGACDLLQGRRCMWFRPQRRLPVKRQSRVRVHRQARGSRGRRCGDRHVQIGHIQLIRLRHNRRICAEHNRRVAARGDEGQLLHSRRFLYILVHHARLRCDCLGVVPDVKSRRYLDRGLLPEGAVA